MKRILVCSDLTDRSHSALRRAGQLAQPCSAALTICLVLDDDFPSKLDDVRKREAVDDLARTCKSLGYDGIDIVVDIGEPVATILSVAARVEADLLVLGGHRHRPFSDLVGRTTPERLVHGGHRPVLLVPNPVTSPYGRILSGVDLSPSCEAAIKLARLLAPSATFTTFHAVNARSPGWFARSSPGRDKVASLTAEVEKRLEVWWRDRKIPEDIDRPIVIPRPLLAAFREMRYKVKPDLVALGAHGRSGLAHGTLGSFTETIVRWQFCDVLVASA